MGVHLSCCGCLLEDFAPIAEELLQAPVGKRMIEELVDNFERHGSDMGASHCRGDNVVWRAERRREDLGLVAVVVVDLDDLVDEFHSIQANVV
jgi:hypothetical protein